MSLTGPVWGQRSHRLSAHSSCKLRLGRGPAACSDLGICPAQAEPIRAPRPGLIDPLWCPARGQWSQGVRAALAKHRLARGQPRAGFGPQTGSPQTAHPPQEEMNSLSPFLLGHPPGPHTPGASRPSLIGPLLHMRARRPREKIRHHRDRSGGPKGTAQMRTGTSCPPSSLSDPWLL